MHLQKSLLVLMFLPFTYAAFGGHVGRKQSAAVKGSLRCDGKPAQNVLVKLYDVDKGLDADDLLAKGKTDGQGNFYLSGNTREIGRIDPKLNIYHNCKNRWHICSRKVSIKLPKRYITKGAIPKKVFDLGTIELAGKFKGETRDCFH